MYGPVKDIAIRDEDKRRFVKFDKTEHKNSIVISEALEIIYRLTPVFVRLGHNRIAGVFKILGFVVTMNLAIPCLLCVYIFDTGTKDP